MKYSGVIPQFPFFGVRRSIKIAGAVAGAKAMVAKKKTIIYTKTKILVTKEFMAFIAKDPSFQGVGLAVGIAGGVAGIFSFGHQLYFSSHVPFTEDQMKVLMENINTEDSKNLKIEIRNGIQEILETRDLDSGEKVHKQELELYQVKAQRNTIAITCAGLVLFMLFGQTKGLEILAQEFI